jgi:hypothetical protein
METLLETYKEMELSPLDEQGLEQIQKALEALGLTAVRTETGTVRAELKRFGTNYILAHFVSGREVFYTDEHIFEMQERRRPGQTNAHLQKLQRKQDMWVEKDERTYHPLSKRIFIVDLDNAAADPLYSRFVQEIELDLYAAQKWVCTLEGLREALSCPFRPVAHRAFEQPFAHYTRASVSEFDKPGPDFKVLVTWHFNPADFRTMCKQLMERKNRAGVLSVAATIFARIMGSSYSLVENDGDLEMVRGPGPSMPDFMIGNGERTAMSFCLFLALAHDRMAEGMCIGIKESLNTLDSLRLIKTMAVLSEFVIATGASVYLQTDKSENLQFAKLMLEEAVKIAGEGSKATFF